MNGVANFRDFREHHGCAAAHQQVRGVADSGVSGHAGKSVAATALHTHHQLGGRAGDALALVEFFQMAHGNLQNIVDHWAKTNMLFILQTYDAGAVDRDALHIFCAFQQALWL